MSSEGKCLFSSFKHFQGSEINYTKHKKVNCSDKYIYTNKTHNINTNSLESSQTTARDAFLKKGNHCDSLNGMNEFKFKDIDSYINHEIFEVKRDLGFLSDKTNSDQEKVQQEDPADLPALVSDDDSEDDSEADSEDDSEDESPEEPSFWDRSDIKEDQINKILRINKVAFYKTDLSRAKWTIPSRDAEIEKTPGYFNDDRNLYQVCRDVINQLVAQKIKPGLAKFFSELAGYDITDNTWQELPW